MNNNQETTSACPPTANNAAKVQQKIGAKGLNMTKLGKGDLLRLLSILEGELEARDIYISTLQAQLNRDRHVKERYFHNCISDPFMALVRDNEAMCESIPTSKENSRKSFANEVVRVEPLTLLEKYVLQFKRQQVKMRQHFSLSDMYYSLLNDELQEVKQLTVVDGEGRSASDLKCEQLEIQLKSEKCKTQKLELNYKKLLQIIMEERRKYKTIITMLLAERSGHVVPDLNDDLKQNDLRVKHQQLVNKNKDLEAMLRDHEDKEAILKGKITELTGKLSKPDVISVHDETNKENIEETHLVEGNHLANADESFKLPRQDLSELPQLLLHKTPECIDDSASTNSEPNDIVVSVKRTSTIIERRNLGTGEKAFLTRYKTSKSAEKMDERTSGRTDFSHSSSTLRVSDQVAARTSDLNLKLSATIVSSPTSGAANFALNSPNEPPNKSVYSSAIHGSKSMKPVTIPSSSFQATRQKFQRFAKNVPSPPMLNNSHDSHLRKKDSLHGTKSNQESSETVSSSLPLVAKTSKATAKKSSDVSAGFKPQPPKPPKNNGGKSACCNSTNDGPTQPPPLPPKKPNLLVKNSGKTPGGRTPREHEATKKSTCTTSERALRLAGSKSAENVPTKTLTNSTTNNKNNVKRPTSLNTNNNNNNSRTIKRGSTGVETCPDKMQPTPPAAPHRLLLSAQQRLFPPQDGDEGQLRSPITHTVPKSPLGSGFFTFK